MPASLHVNEYGAISISGDLDFQSVPELCQNSAKLFSAQTALRIDLTDVNRCDSSGVALLVEWLRQARSGGQRLEFVNIPMQMQAIIQVTDLEELLPLE